MEFLRRLRYLDEAHNFQLAAASASGRALALGRPGFRWPDRQGSGGGPAVLPYERPRLIRSARCACLEDLAPLIAGQQRECRICWERILRKAGLQGPGARWPGRGRHRGVAACRAPSATWVFAMCPSQWRVGFPGEPGADRRLAPKADSGRPGGGCFQHLAGSFGHQGGTASAAPGRRRCG